MAILDAGITGALAILAPGQIGDIAIAEGVVNLFTPLYEQTSEVVQGEGILGRAGTTLMNDPVVQRATQGIGTGASVGGGIGAGVGLVAGLFIGVEESKRKKKSKREFESATLANKQAERNKASARGQRLAILDNERRFEEQDTPSALSSATFGSASAGQDNRNKQAASGTF